MPAFSQKSKDKLKQAHPQLQQLFNEVIKYYDCAILESIRTEEQQNRYFKTGLSKLKYPNSRHNVVPPEVFSRAVDVVPYEGKGPDWRIDQCIHFGGFVKGIAATLGISIRWGGDWDGDNDVNDQTFNDLVHFELKF